MNGRYRLPLVIQPADRRTLERERSSAAGWSRTVLVTGLAALLVGFGSRELAGTARLVMVSLVALAAIALVGMVLRRAPRT